jgi:hypothetical protein
VWALAALGWRTRRPPGASCANQHGHSAHMVVGATAILDLTATLGDVGGLMPEGVQHKAAAATDTGMATATATAGAGAIVMTSMSSVEAVVAFQPVGHPKAYTGPGALV